MQDDTLALTYPVTGAQRAARAGGVALLNEPLDLGARQVGEARRQDLVEPRAGIFRRHDHGEAAALAQCPALAPRKASSSNSPTPTQMALSATLKAGQW